MNGVVVDICVLSVPCPKIHLLDGLELTCFQDGRIDLGTKQGSGVVNNKADAQFCKG